MDDDMMRHTPLLRATAYLPNLCLPSHDSIGGSRFLVHTSVTQTTAQPEIYSISVSIYYHGPPTLAHLDHRYIIFYFTSFRSHIVIANISLYLSLIRDALFLYSRSEVHALGPPNRRQIECARPWY